MKKEKGFMLIELLIVFAIIGILLAVLIPSCGSIFIGKYEETGLGEVQVIREGAMWRSEGGGIQDKEIWAGTTKVAGATVDVEAFRVPYGPRTIVIPDLPVIMTTMKNQELKFTPSLIYMKDPTKAVKTFTNFKSSTQEITKIFRESCLRILSKLDMSLDIGQDRADDVMADGTLTTFNDREVVSKAIFDDFEKSFKIQYLDYVDCFYFIAVNVGNVGFNPDIITKMEGAVAAQYDYEALEYQATLEDLQGQILVAKSEADSSAYDIEASVMNDDVVGYMGMGLVEKFIDHDMIYTHLIIPLDERGGIAWFNADHIKETNN